MGVKVENVKSEINAKRVE